ncbi:unnamed protein product [Auanema sp. JU1783]|nr:unnamed protein product [Auanema sp. JU1783]
MLAVWDFVRQHKKKIIFGGVVVGGVVGAMSYHKHEQQHVVSDDELIQKKNRRRYVYDSNHSTCDDSIRDLAKNLFSLVEKRFEVDSYILRIQTDESMENAEKIKLWEKIKVNSFARIVALSYSFSILTIVLKIQFSILTAVICNQIEQPKKDETSYNKLTTMFDKSEDQGLDTAGSKQTFLKCIQFFTSSGIYKLFDMVENAIEKICVKLSLVVDSDRHSIRHLFDCFDQEISPKLEGELWKLIAPIPEDMDSSDEIVKLLLKLVGYLNTSDCTFILYHLLDFYYSASCRKLSNESEKLARNIPIISDAFEDVGSTSYDGPLKNSLCSSELHSFSQMVFKTYKD